MQALKKYGQNFLKDKNTILKIVNLVEEKNIILEIGPGMGALTDYLVEMKPNKLVLFEIDQRMVEYLNEKYVDENIVIEHEDILKVKKFWNESTTVISNLPYYITTPIIFKIIESELDYTKLIFMMQKEVALRVCANHSTKDYGIISVLIQIKHNVKKEFDVSKNVFIPQPKVTSSIVTITKKNNKISDEEYLFLKDIVKTAFSQRRKKVKSNLKQIIDIKLIDDVFKKLELSDDIRAENISPEQYYEITKEFLKNGKENK